MARATEALIIQVTGIDGAGLETMLEYPEILYMLPLADDIDRSEYGNDCGDWDCYSEDSEDKGAGYRFAEELLQRGELSLAGEATVCWFETNLGGYGQVFKIYTDDGEHVCALKIEYGGSGGASAETMYLLPESIIALGAG